MIKRKIHLNNKNEQGIALLLAVLVLASILAISFSLASIMLTEVKNSGDLLRTEPALYAASSITEEAIFKFKRSIPVGYFAYSTAVGNVKISTTTESEIADPIYQDSVLPNSDFEHTLNHYILGQNCPSNNPDCGSGYVQAKITYLNSANPDDLTIYICEYSPSPTNPYSSLVCSDTASTEYWIRGSTQSDNNRFVLNYITNEHTWYFNPLKQQEIIVYNNGSSGKIYIQLETFGPDLGGDGNPDPKGIPYLNKKSVEINAENAGLNRKIRVVIPK
jgi:hypothetical protein